MPIHPVDDEIFYWICENFDLLMVLEISEGSTTFSRIYPLANMNVNFIAIHPIIVRFQFGER